MERKRDEEQQQEPPLLLPAVRARQKTKGGH